MPFFGDCELVSNAFYEALLEAGVKNLMAYEAQIQNDDESVVHKGYKALNIIGGRMRSSKRTNDGDSLYSADCMLEPEDEQEENNRFDPKALLIFQTAKFACIVHERLKEHLQAKGIPHLVFTQPSEWND